MIGNLLGSRYVLVGDPAEAEVLIVNTCGFIEAAKKESIDAILEAARYKKTGRLKTLVVAGCLAQRYGEDLRKEMPEIDVLVGLNDVENLAARLRGGAALGKSRRNQAVSRAGALSAATYVNNAASPRWLSTPPHYAYVKISEGCDLPCSFCVIPRIRGRFRSRPLEDIEREARALAALGVREVCLVAQDSTWYGSDLYGKPRIAELLRRLSSVRELEWVRLHYLYPSRVTDELLEAMSHPRVAPYFDVPFQHASDRILKSMRRIGGRREISALLRRIRARHPKAALRSTFILGYPGETEGEFRELMDFLREERLDYAGFFAFSPEEQTPAAGLPGQVPEKIKRERLARAYQTQESLAAEAHRKWIGESLRVVLEGSAPGKSLIARSCYQAPEVDGVLRVEGAGRRSPGEWLDVEIIRVLGQDLVARARPSAVSRPTSRKKEGKR